MKRKYSILGVAASLLLGLALPLYGSAAETGDTDTSVTDSITLETQDDKVAVSVSAGNAYNEGVTSLALEVAVELDNPASADAVTFEFSSELKGMVNGYRYESGKLKIYVAAPQSGSFTPLFDKNNELALGTIQIKASGQGENITAAIGSKEDRFQTVNGAYGTKASVIDSAPEPVTIEAGSSGSNTEEPGKKPDDGNQSGGQEQGGNDNQGGSDSQGSNNQNGGSQSGNNQNDSGNNSSSGLYDENTQLVNDPRAAVKIPSNIITDNGAATGLADLSQAVKQGTAPIKIKASSGEKAGQEDSKVTVIDPADGPDGILVTSNDGADENASGDGTAQSSGALSDGASADGQNGVGKDGTGKEGSAEGEEILLDKENGGVQGQKKQKVSGKQTILIVVLAAAALCIIAGAVFFIRGSRNNSHKNRRGRKNSGHKKRS